MGAVGPRVDRGLGAVEPLAVDDHLVELRQGFTQPGGQGKKWERVIFPHLSQASHLTRFPLVSAHFWTVRHRSSRFRSLDGFAGTRDRQCIKLKGH